MTVETVDGSGDPITKSGPYNGNGVTADFDFDFQVQADTELLVTRQNADGTETELTLTTHYTVTGVGVDAGGNITLVDPATDLPTGTALVIQYDGDYSQGTDWSNQGSLALGLLEDALDKVAMHLRSIKEQVDRSVKVDSFGTVDTDTLTTNLTVVAGLEAEISALALLTTEIASLYANIADINTVAGDTTEISALAALTTEISALALLTTEIASLYANVADINTVAGDTAAINALALITTELTTLYTNIASITGLAPYTTEIATIYANLTALLSAVFELANDTTPQLGGDLDANGHAISGLAPTITVYDTAAAAFTHTFAATTRRAVFRICGGGSGGGGANSGTTLTNCGVGGGGTSGAEVDFIVDVASAGLSSVTLTVGAKGPAGSDGGDTIYSDGSNTVTATGGVAGLSRQNITGVVMVRTSTPPSPSKTLVSNITVLREKDGSPGGNGIAIPQGSTPSGGGTDSVGGEGASSSYGSGGRGSATVTNDSSNAGEAATGNGAAGGGATALGNTTYAAGGAGTPGIIIVEEYPY